MQGANYTHVSGVHAFAASLKACAKQKDAKRGLDIHAEIARLGLLDRHTYVGSALVDMYAKCGLLAKAQQVFENLTVQDTASWNVLMTAHTNCGHGEEVLKTFEKMRLVGIFPNGISFVCSLKACILLGAMHKGKEIHVAIENEGLLETNIYIGSTVVDMYAKFGALSKARQVFHSLPTQNLATWNSLISGYAEHQHGKEALECLKQMQFKGLIPNAITMVCALKACSSIGGRDECLDIHAEISRKGLLEKNVIIGTSLVDMYAKRGWLVKAQEVLDKLLIRNTISWTTLIAGYIEQGHGKEALECVQRMQQEGIVPDTTTLACSLKACSSLCAVDKGREIHAEVERRGLLGRDVTLANSLVDMYFKCGLLAHAQEVFDQLRNRDVVSWTVLISGYLENGDSEEAIKHFENMQLYGVSPNAVSLACSLKACGSIGDLDKGQEIHGEVERRGLSGDLVIGNTLVDMYAKCGSVSKARSVFDRLSERDVVSWNALISGYAEIEQGEEALACFDEMQAQGFSPDPVTFVCSLKACASMGADATCQELHSEIARKGFLEGSIVVGSTLVDMYAKCGLLAIAEQVFEKLPIQDVVSWNSLMAGYTQLGEIRRVFFTFNKMLRESVRPDMVTFLIVLNACSCSGLVHESGTYFEAMSKDFGIVPVLEHHSCMVDLLGRGGNLDKAVAAIRKMPFCPNIVVWNTMLSACKTWGNVKLGREVFENALCLDYNHSAHILMS